MKFSRCTLILRCAQQKYREETESRASPRFVSEMTWQSLHRDVTLVLFKDRHRKFLVVDSFRDNEIIFFESCATSVNRG